MKKHNSKQTLSVLLFMISSVIILLGISACDKNEESITVPEETVENVISNEEAAGIIAEELSGDDAAYGVTAIADDVSKIAYGSGVADIVDESETEDYLENDSTIVIEDNVPPYTYNIRLSYGYSFIKDGGVFDTWVPGIDSVKLRYRCSALYSAPGISGSRNAYTSDLEAYGFLPGSDIFELRGSYLWLGTNTINRVNSNLSFNIWGEINIRYIKYDKTKMKITEGSADIYMHGESGSGGNFEITAEVTFNGDGTASIIINGETYVVDLETGEVDK